MNVKKLLKVLKLMPGIDLKEVVTYFNNLLRDFIIEKAKQELTNPNNFIVLLSAVDPQGDLCLIPVEMERETKKIVKEHAVVNTSQIIRETNIDKALDIFTAKDCELSFFEVLEQAKDVK